jgi:hypothetical protein
MKDRPKKEILMYENTNDPEETQQKSPTPSITPKSTNIQGEGAIGILKFLAWSDLIASICGAIWVWINYGKTDLGLWGLTETNPIGIATGFVVLFQGIITCTVFLVIAAIDENVIAIRKKLGV